MIILTQDRKDNLHLVDYTAANGNKFTLCGVMYRKKDILNTLALDNAVHNICRTCYENYETMYIDDLEHDPRMVHSDLNRRMDRKFRFPMLGNPLPEIKYWDMEHKVWDKLTKYQRKLARK